MSGPLANKKHEAVAQAFIKSRDKVGWRAYASVFPGTSDVAARKNWSRLSHRDDFRRRLEELQIAAANEAVLTEAKVLAEIGHMAFGNMLDYTRIHGSQLITDFSQLTREQAAAIRKVKVKTTRQMVGEGDDAEEIEVQTTEFELHDKLKGLELLGRNLKLFADRIEHDVAGNLASRLEEVFKAADRVDEASEG